MCSEESKQNITLICVIKMNYKVYKWCAVPLCKNTSIKTPNKVFVYVPNKQIIRAEWLKLARRNPNDIVTDSRLYFCEDHFDLPNDMENYMEYHVMGSVSQVRMKPGCMPHKFLCQTDEQSRTSDTTEQPYITKKRRKMISETCKKEVKDVYTTETVSQHEVREAAGNCAGACNVQGSLKPTSTMLVEQNKDGSSTDTASESGEPPATIIYKIRDLKKQASTGKTEQPETQKAVKRPVKKKPKRGRKKKKTVKSQNNLEVVKRKLGRPRKKKTKVVNASSLRSKDSGNRQHERHKKHSGVQNASSLCKKKREIRQRDHLGKHSEIPNACSLLNEENSDWQYAEVRRHREVPNACSLLNEENSDWQYAEALKSSYRHNDKSDNLQYDDLRKHNGYAMIAKVYDFLLREYQYMQLHLGEDYDLTILSDVVSRTASATGVSHHTVLQVLGRSVVELEQPEQPQEQRPEHQRVLDDTLVRLDHNYYNWRQRPKASKTAKLKTRRSSGETRSPDRRPEACRSAASPLPEVDLTDLTCRLQEAQQTFVQCLEQEVNPSELGDQLVLKCEVFEDGFPWSYETEVPHEDMLIVKTESNNNDNEPQQCEADEEPQNTAKRRRLKSEPPDEEYQHTNSADHHEESGVSCGEVKTEPDDEEGQITHVEDLVRPQTNSAELLSMIIA